MVEVRGSAASRKYAELRERLEMQNVGAHAALGEAHSMTLRLLERMNIRPAVVLDAVTGNDGSGAVLAAAAVHENRIGTVYQDRERALHFVLVGGGKRLHRQIDVLDVKLLYLALFRLRTGACLT